MADGTQAGPLCQATRPLLVEDGTACRMPSPRPGPLCPTRPDGFGDYARRVRNVKDAFLLGVTEYAYRETVAKLGADLRLVVDSLWPGFVQALKIYAWSIGGGAVLFGVAGAVLGEGVGAAPGALIGAKIGAAVGTFILEFLGLRFLVEYVLAHLHEASAHFRTGFDRAWQACGDPPLLGGAALEFGRGIADLLSLFLQAAVAWVLKRGLKAGLEDLNKSEAGRALAPYAKVQYWRQKLGVTDAPVPRRGIATTIEFFEEQTGDGRLQPMDETRLRSYWSAMDFSRDVSQETLAPGTELVAYRDPQSPFGFYYTEPGNYLDRLGVDYVTEQSLPKERSGAQATRPARLHPLSRDPAGPGAEVDLQRRSGLGHQSAGFRRQRPVLHPAILGGSRGGGPPSTRLASNRRPQPPGTA